jgi:hypothetical protein
VGVKKIYKVILPMVSIKKAGIMAYKKYHYRNGKKYGPYFYESYRDENGKVCKRYIGNESTKNKKGVDVGVLENNFDEKKFSLKKEKKSFFGNLFGMKKDLVGGRKK